MKRGDFDSGYNAQACAEESHGIIIVADLTNDPADTEHLPQVVEEVRELRQELGFSAEDGKQTQMSADSGYFSADNIKAEGDGIEPLIASGREKPEEERESTDNRVYSLKRFYDDKEGDVWRCPEGRLLKKEAVQAGGKYRYVCPDCAGGKLRARCLMSGEDRRTLVVEEGQLLPGEMRARLKQPEKHAVARKRKWVAEQPIGQIKEGLGFRGGTMRGEDYALGQWRFVCAVQNAMKAVRLITSSRKSGKMEAITAVA